ncbi:ribonuclease P 40kDa subunit-domain-containing protein [Xylariaceae sp. FL1019]|nr:ribonuclease P 40kDa subunit-domain-containing protein [Xylariaceae sp. FL1019]
MFAIPDPSVYQSSRCAVTYGTMAHPDADQLPKKVKPWSSLLSQDFVHKVSIPDSPGPRRLLVANTVQVDLVLPDDLAHLIEARILRESTTIPGYERVIMTLGQILEGDFFTQYIKIGNIMMLSEGRVNRDNVFSIKDGVLTMYVDKETYERAGLVGEPHGAKGARGRKPVWVIKYDLRAPSALHGKKGFDRLVYACKNVLNKPTTWLFCNLSNTPEPDPLLQHLPTKYTSQAGLRRGMKVQVPRLQPPTAFATGSSRSDLDEFATEVYEWLSLIRLESPRVEASDDIDPYLSTYTVPGIPSDAAEGTLCKISWQGFISPMWVARTLAEVIRTLPAKSWFSLSATSFTPGAMGHGRECTMMRPPDSAGEYFQWEIKSHE